MGFYLIAPLVTLISLGSISSWVFKPYCDDELLCISPTEITAITDKSATPKWQYATKTVLMKDLMLTPGVLKQMCDTDRELYNFMKVCVLFDL